jgi:hypothetical protein
MRGVPALVWRWSCIALTFHAVCFAWCFFRLTRLPDSLACVRKWIDFDFDKAFVGGSADIALWVLLSAYALAALAVHLLTRGAQVPAAVEQFSTQPLRQGALWGSTAGTMVLAILLAPGAQTLPFIYFQF